MEEEDQLKYYESQTPRFFRIILHETLETGKLSFPRSFVQKHGRSLCLDKVYLRVSSGDAWEVEFLKDEDGDMWLHNGWREFVEFYDIKFGYFLVFDYQRNSEFQVFIFDKTTSEIKYPYKCSNNMEDSDPVPWLLSVKPEIEESDVEMVVDHNACDSDCMFLNNRSQSTNQIRKEFRDRYVNGELGNCKSREKAEAVIRTRSFTSPNPYFRVLMQATYVNYNFVLHLPAKFILDHIGRKDCHMKLSLPCGRSWIVKCRLRIRNNRPDAKIQIGWKSFAKENKLAVGDVCVFELMDSVKVHFRVTIFRATSNPSPSHCPVESVSRKGQIPLKPLCHEAPSASIPFEAPSDQTSSNPSFKIVMTEAPESESRECIDGQVSPKPLCHEEPSADNLYEAPECPNNETSKNPSFKVFMTEAFMRRYTVPVQGKFMKHLKQIKQDVRLEVAGRFWRMKCYCYPHIRQAILAGGWRNFAKDNFLRAGDVCIFELVDKEEMALKVSIYRGSE